LVLVVEVTEADDGMCQVRLRVRDSGVGLDEATGERVFEPFEQGDSATNRRHGGTGLGLPIVRMLARLMGGDVSVRSRPGQGSEFRVELRLPAQGAQPLRTLARADTAAGRMWVLARNGPLGQGLCRRLERVGWSVELIPDVVTAIDRLRSGGVAQAPGCVLIAEDVLAPHSDVGSLRRCLPPGTSTVLLLRPDFDLGAVHGATDQRDMKVLVAPLVPADLYALFQSPGTPQPSIASPASPQRPEAAAQRFVLIVEDNPMNQIIAREMVAALGLTPVVVGSGQDALDSCQSMPPDLVLMDIQMPDMDGLETTRRLRALQAAGELRHFPIIALTAHAMASDRQASLEAGMDEHLTKPVQLETLRGVLGYWIR
jgi:CheY-like chemotaxis protein